MANQEKKRCAIYARVSRDSQTVDPQENELHEFAERRGWAVVGSFFDRGVSGIKEKRPALDELLKACRHQKTDVVLVWKFDRFARSVKQLVTALHEFHELGIDFVSLTEQIDTSTAMGKATFHILGAVAELERSLMAERTIAGLREARRKGKRLGRPPIKLSPELVSHIKTDRVSKRMSLRTLAKRHSVSLWSIQRLLQRGFAVT